MSPPIFLIGYRGTGKSTIGPLLAEALDASFFDSDRIIAENSGQSISDIFADRGESHFRDLEEQVVADLSRRESIVAALGGGAILREASRACISTSGLVIWLTADPSMLATRLTGDENSQSQRPTLTGLGLTQEIEEVLAERLPLYQECADLTIETTTLSPTEVVSEILELLSAEAEDVT